MSGCALHRLLQGSEVCSINGGSVRKTCRGYYHRYNSHLSMVLGLLGSFPQNTPFMLQILFIFCNYLLYLIYYYYNYTITLEVVVVVVTKVITEMV